MAKTYTTDQLIDLTRNRARLPDVAAQGSADADVIAALNEALLQELVPWIMDFREEYFVTTDRTTLTANQSHVSLPTRAVGQKVRDVLFRDDATSGAVRQLTHVSRKEIPDYSDQSGEPIAMYMEGNQHLVLMPANTNAGRLLDISYFRSPGDLVLLSEARVVQSVDSATQVTLTATAPTGWAATNTFDIHSPDSGASLRSQGLTVSVLGSNTIQFNENIDGSVFGTHAVAVGDYVCLEGEAVVPGLPRELHPVLAQAAAVILLHNEQDTEALKNASAVLNRQLERCKTILEERIEARPKRVHGRNSLLWKQENISGWY